MSHSVTDKLDKLWEDIQKAEKQKSVNIAFDVLKDLYLLAESLNMKEELRNEKSDTLFDDLSRLVKEGWNDEEQERKTERIKEVKKMIVEWKKPLLNKLHENLINADTVYEKGSNFPTCSKVPDSY